MSDFQGFGTTVGDSDTLDSTFSENETMALTEGFTAQINEVRPARGNRPQQSFVTRVLSGNHTRDGELYRTMWLWGFLPLPVINYILLWRRYGPRDIRAIVERVTGLILIITLQTIRFFVFGLNIIYWASLIISRGSNATYSEKYLGNILSYIVRDYPQMAERQFEMDLQDHGFWSARFQSWRSFIYDLMAYNVSTSIRSRGGILTRVLKSDTLIYKFSDAVTKSGIVSRLPPIGITIFTVGIYLIYTVVAMLLNLNIGIMVALQFRDRLFPMAGFFKNIIKSVWHQTSPVLF